MIIVPMADPHYSTAATSFQKAVWMQMGVDKTLDRCQYNIDVISKDMEKKAYAFMDSLSPIPHEKLMFLFGTAYSIGVKQEISGSFGNPFIKTATHTIKITPQSSTFNMTIPL
jgi:hypothetical protein